MTTNEATLHELERLALAYAQARAVVSERVDALQREIDALRRRRIKGIKAAWGEAGYHQERLKAAVAAHPELFEKPRTMVLHGVKFGLQKGRGTVSYADEAAVIARIDRLLPEQADVLVKTTRRLVKKALAGLDTRTLARLGCTLEETADQVVVKVAGDEIDKIVARILEEGATAIEAGAAEA